MYEVSVYEALLGSAVKAEASARCVEDGAYAVRVVCDAWDLSPPGESH